MLLQLGCLCRLRRASTVPQGQHHTAASWNGPHLMQIMVAGAEREKSTGAWRNESISIRVVEGEFTVVVVDAATTCEVQDRRHVVRWLIRGVDVGRKRECAIGRRCVLVVATCYPTEE